MYDPEEPDYFSKNQEPYSPSLPYREKLFIKSIEQQKT